MAVAGRFWEVISSDVVEDICGALSRVFPPRPLLGLGFHHHLHARVFNCRLIFGY